MEGSAGGCAGLQIVEQGSPCRLGSAELEVEDSETIERQATGWRRIDRPTVAEALEFLDGGLLLGLSR